MRFVSPCQIAQPCTASFQALTEPFSNKSSSRCAHKAAPQNQISFQLLPLEFRPEVHRPLALGILAFTIHWMA